MTFVAFLHPDLGIGGAERLVVDAALALKSKGCVVRFITTHHDPNHCFAETKDGTFPVTVVGDWIPRSILGRFHAVCAYIRMIYAAFYLTFFSGLCPDVVFCDLVSVCIPILKLRGLKVVFYCHFPDQLLSKPGGYIKTMYRVPLNWLEKVTTGLADRTLVNSKFTSNIFKETFSGLEVNPKVLYPSLNTEFFDQPLKASFQRMMDTELSDNAFIFLSINRYERKKNLGLALQAMEVLHSTIDDDLWSKVHLIIAGGYDNQLQENIEYFRELQDMYNAKPFLKDHVTFLKSPSDELKLSLLRESSCLLYTPENEHFGIVPLEAMYCKTPVIAVNSGGPTETIIHEVTGYLCDPKSAEFAEAMKKCVQDNALVKKMGQSGNIRVQQHFSFSAFSGDLYSIISELLRNNMNKFSNDPNKSK